VTELQTAPPYKYRDIPLTPKVIADLAQQVMRTPMFRRSELIEAVQDHHAANGGAPATGAIVPAAKKALTVLVASDLLEPAGGYGLWRWVTPPGPAGDASAITEAAPLEGTEELDVTDDTTIDGEGSGNVYVYYFPSYKALADLRNENRWPIKVGMTSLGNAQIRISEQQGTAMPEQPVVAYVRRTDTPLKLERLVHAVLFYRGQQLEDAPGSEWFNANPEEVRAIIHWAHGEVIG
jgi:hypothetical protein